MSNNCFVGITISHAENATPNEIDAPIPPFGPAPTWLHDLKRLVPLQVAFEEEVKEKSDVIADYEAQVTFQCHLYHLENKNYYVL